MDRTLGQIRILGECAARVALRALAGDGDALFDLFHDVLRDADLFDDLIYGFAVVKLDAEVLCDPAADLITLRAVFASYCNNKMCHILFLSNFSNFHE